MTGDLADEGIGMPTASSLHPFACPLTFHQGSPPQPYYTCLVLMLALMASQITM